MLNSNSSFGLAGLAFLPMASPVRVTLEGVGEGSPLQLSGWQSIEIFMAVVLVVWLLLIWQSALSSREQQNSAHAANSEDHSSAEPLS